MREHMPSDARVHYAALDAGGIAPNVVQANAKVRYLIRARNLPGRAVLSSGRVNAARPIFFSSVPSAAAGERTGRSHQSARE
jgi:hypothetical protein